MSLKIGWFCTLIHDHPEPEGIVVFEDTPKKGDRFLLPSSDFKQEWEVASVYEHNMEITAVRPDKDSAQGRRIGQFRNDTMELLPGTAGWHPAPPDSEGFWWLWGDEEYGTMGGNYTDAIPPDIKLRVVEVRTMGSGKNARLYGVNSGREVPLTPFDRENKEPGYVGVWQKAITPTPPKET